MAKRKPVDLRELERLAENGVSDKDIGKLLKISTSTLHLYRVRIQLGRAKLHARLMEAMIEKALVDKNPTMLVWLSKNVLNWSDRVVYESQPTPQETIKLEWANSPTNPNDNPATAKSVAADSTEIVIKASSS